MHTRHTNGGFFLRCLLIALLSACLLPSVADAAPRKRQLKAQMTLKETTAVEDLYSEHGILRRILLIYRQTAKRLRQNPRTVNMGALRDAAVLFRDFGEDYHERICEETYVFPIVRKLQGPTANLPIILTDQHDRGRALTDAILAYAGKASLTSQDTASLAQILDNMADMYDNHAAREDTIVFPAWKRALSAKQYKEMEVTFERIERERFGLDAFERAAAQVSAIEKSLGYADLAQFTAPVLSTVLP